MGCTESKQRPAPRSGAAQPTKLSDVEKKDEGITPFASSAELVDDYFANIEKLRIAAIERGILAATCSAPREAPAIKPNKKNTPSSSNKFREYESSRALAEAQPPVKTVTAYQCQPLFDQPTVGVGMYSQVFLASMVVVSGEQSAIHPTVARVVPSPSAEPQNLKRAMSHDMHPDGSPGVAAPLPSVERWFLISMKELSLSGRPAGRVFAAIRAEVQQWSRLSSYCPRILKLIQMECVYADRPSSPAAELGLHDFSAANAEVAASPKSSSRLKNIVRTKRSNNGANSKSAGAAAQDEIPKQSPSQVRLYMEFCKFGTLRHFQLNTMREKFAKSYLHELTARAYMREVLLTLLQLHEYGLLQYDLCASNIFLSRPMRSVYRTYFPAFIADIPAGDLSRVPPSNLNTVLRLLDPKCTSPHVHTGSPPTAGSPHHMRETTLSKQVNAPGGSVSFVDAEHPTERPPEPTADSGTNAADSSAMNTSGLHNEPSLTTKSQNTEHLWDAAASVEGLKLSRGLASPELTTAFSKAGFLLEENDERRWLNDGFQEYFRQSQFEDCDSLPAPSPHDGFGSVVEAEMIGPCMTEDTAVYDKMRVMPLEKSSDGGLVVVVPNRFGQVASRAAHAAAGGGEHYISGPPKLMLAGSGSPRTEEGHGGGSYYVTNDSVFVSEDDVLRDSGSSSRRPSLIRLDRTAPIRRALAQGEGPAEEVPVHLYVPTTHAAPEVLRHRQFSPASDMYAFAMTFIELVTPEGELYADCTPTGLPFDQPRTREEKEEYDRQLADNILAWQNKRLDEARRAQGGSEADLSSYADVVVPIPSHLSDECRGMLRWCLQADPKRRPTVIDLLRSRYFLLGNWITRGDTEVRLPEPSWGGDVDYALAAQVVGLPALSPDDYKCKRKAGRRPRG